MLQPPRFTKPNPSHIALGIDVDTARTKEAVNKVRHLGKPALAEVAGFPILSQVTKGFSDAARF